MVGYPRWKLNPGKWDGNPARTPLDHPDSLYLSGKLPCYLTAYNDWTIHWSAKKGSTQTVQFSLVGSSRIANLKSILKHF